MKKTLIAAAVTTAFAGSAMAQATITGVLDFGQTQEKFTAGTTATKSSQSAGEDFNGWTASRVNIAATEDLGGGLKAGANIQMGLAEGGAVTGTRDTFVFVSGGFGHVSLGTRETAINASFDRFNVVGTTNGAGTISFGGGGTGAAVIGAQDAMGGTLGNAQPGNFARQRGLQFTTPSFNGFTAAVDYSNDSSEVSTTAGKAGSTMQAVTLNYTAGPLSFMVSSGDIKTKTAATAVTPGRVIFFNATSNSTATATVAAATTAVGTLVTGAKTGFTIESILLNGVQTTGVSTHAGTLDNASTGVVVVQGVAAAAAAERRAKTTLFGASYNFGMAEVRLGHTMRKDTTATATTSDLKVTTAGVIVPLGSIRLFASAYDGKDARGVGEADNVRLDGNQVGATYSFSKRTMAYAYRGVNDRKVTTGGAVEQKSEGTYFGLTHSF